MPGLVQLQDQGQSFWLDDLTRDLIRSGELARRVREQGLRGVTSNPKIFADAIEGSDTYDQDIDRFARQGLAAEDILDRLTVRDVQDACDILRGVHTDSNGVDGFVSLEVSPRLAKHTQATIGAARLLSAAVGRPNLYIKIPGTVEGLPAIEQAIVDGINVNVTLLFSIERYREVADAYQRGLERRLGAGLPIDVVSSVASFFLSRIDVMTDAHLDAVPEDGRARALALKGLAAIANAKLAYETFRTLRASARWQVLARQGARVQRVLWASTGTKRPYERDVKYIEPLIGPDTISTMPYKTALAFDDHGVVAPTAAQGVEEARRVLGDLASAGVDFPKMTDALVEQGIEKFVAPYEALIRLLDQRRSLAVAADAAPGGRG